jgi:acetylornithine deacetylase/succinyl-diaminopimelate desuccinylase-like protein
MTIQEYFEKNKVNFLNQLIEFLKIPSISSEPQHKDDIRRCAEWLYNNIRNSGIDNVRIIETEGHPIVYAENLEAGEDKPTILFYGHYDVQPVDPLELWNSNPFEPVINNGKLFARGSSDDKGQVFLHIKSIESYLKSNNKLPLNIKFLIEGEEEAGSNHLDEFIYKNKELLQCDCVLISDTEWFSDNVPSLCYSLRGIAYFEVTITGPNRDLHSGTFGGAVDNPIMILSKMISKLKDEYGRITIPDFYENVLPLEDDERENFLRLPFNEKNWLKDLDILYSYGEIGYSILERTWARPSLDINGIYGGYTGEGAKTVLPSKATAKISMRLVPNQEPEEIINKTKKYLEQLLPPTAKMEFKALHGGKPVLIQRNGKEVQSAMAALKKTYNVDPVFMREGGSIPVVNTFTQVLNAPVILMGFGLPGDNVHSPNESFSLDNFFGGIKTSINFIDEYSK